MFRALAANTLISAASFSVVSVIGLLLIPLQVSTYGLEAFGIIALLRLFLPTGMLALLDWGFSETTTLAVAQARVDGSWDRARAQITFLLGLAALIGMLVAVVLMVGATVATHIFHVKPAYQGGYVAAIRITGICSLFLFPSLVIEGVVKGFEEYRTLRAVDVISALSNAIAVVWLIHIDFSFIAMYYALLGSMLVKGTALIGYSLRRSQNSHVFRLKWDRKELPNVILRCRLMAWNKALGTLQTQAALLFIGIFLPSAAAGAYDILVKLPRFVKSILGLLNSALLPFAAKLDAAEDDSNMRRLGQAGLLMLAAGCTPPLLAGFAFSEPILRLWIGPQLANFWIWQGMMFIVPLLSTFVSFGGTALMARPHVVKSMNRYVTLQILLQFLIAFLLLGKLEERAFILGQTIATVLTFVFQMRLIFREQDIRRSLMWQLSVICAIVVSAVIGTVSSGIPLEIKSLVGLISALTIWSVTLWSAIYLCAFTSAQRTRMTNLLVQYARK